VYPGARLLLDGGLRSTYHAQNALLRERLVVDPGIEPAALDLLFDPQTSGGLLMGVAPGSAQALVAALHEAGDASANVIGVVTSRQGPKTGIEVRSGDVKV
jgi:selenide,water dikinase